MPVAVVKEEVDWDENVGTINTCVGPERASVDGCENIVEAASDGRVEFPQASAVPCEILREAAWSVCHRR